MPSVIPFTSALLRKLAIGALMGVLLTTAAHAGNVGRILESVVGRYVMLETTEGVQILARLSGEAVLGCGTACRERAFQIAQIRLESTEMTAVRAELEARLSRIEEHVPDSNRHAENKLTEDDLVAIKSATPYELKLNSSWTFGESGLDFFETPRGNSLERAEADFVGKEKADPAFSKTAKDAVPAKERKGMTKSFKDYMERMKSCRTNTPPAKGRQWGYLLRQLGIDEAMTVTGKVVAAGSLKDVDWSELPRDLAFEALSSAGGSRMTWVPGKFMVRWFRLAVAGAVTQAGVETVVYYVTPMKGVEQQQKPDDDIANWQFYAAWSAGYPPIQIGMYELSMGLECLYPKGLGGALVYGFELGAGLVTNIAYFRIQTMFENASRK